VNLKEDVCYSIVFWSDGEEITLTNIQDLTQIHINSTNIYIFLWYWGLKSGSTH
jgi:hypothetical protein